jgi:hypothetical protein
MLYIFLNTQEETSQHSDLLWLYLEGLLSKQSLLVVSS